MALGNLEHLFLIQRSVAKMAFVRINKAMANLAHRTHCQFNLVLKIKGSKEVVISNFSQCLDLKNNREGVREIVRMLTECEDQQDVNQ